MKTKTHTDENFAELAASVAGQIIDDYRGLTIGDENQKIMTGQLEIRIARSLRAFHHHEGWMELSE